MGLALGLGADVVVNTLRDDGLFKLARIVKLEEVTRSQSEKHALVVGLQVEIHLGENEGSQLAFGEGFIFKKRLAEESKV